MADTAKCESFAQSLVQANTRSKELSSMLVMVAGATLSQDEEVLAHKPFRPVSHALSPSCSFVKCELSLRWRYSSSALEGLGGPP